MRMVEFGTSEWFVMESHKIKSNGLLNGLMVEVGHLPLVGVSLKALQQLPLVCFLGYQRLFLLSPTPHVDNEL
jgi:hypothetical protein